MIVNSALPDRKEPGPWTRRLAVVCRVVSAVALASVGFVLFVGGGRWHVLGISFRLDDPTNPLLILATCQGVLAWIRSNGELAGAARLARAGEAAGWTVLALLLVTLPVDRSVAGRSSTAWRKNAVAAAVAVFAVARFAEWRRRRDLEGEAGSGAKDTHWEDGIPKAEPPSPDRAQSGVAVEPSARSALCLDAVTGFFALWTLWALVAAIASDSRPDTLAAWSNNWLPALGMFWLARVSWTGESAARRLALLLAGALALALVLGGIQVLFGDLRFDLAPQAPDGFLHRLRSARATGLSLHPNFLAALMAGLLMFMLAMGADATNRKRAAAFYGPAALGMGILVLTRSRGGVIAAVCAAVFVAVASRKRWALPLLLVAGIGLLSLAGVHRERFLGLVRVVTEGEAPPELVGWRPALWKEALRMIREHPWMGWGTGQEVFEAAFRQRRPEGGNPIEAFHAHNLYLETAFETGFTGLGFFGILLGGVTGKAWQSRRRRGPVGRTLSLGAAAALFAFLLHGLVDYPLNRGTWLFFGVLLGILAGGNYTSQGKDPESAGPLPTDPAHSRDDVSHVEANTP